MATKTPAQLQTLEVMLPDPKWVLPFGSFGNHKGTLEAYLALAIRQKAENECSIRLLGEFLGYGWINKEIHREQVDYLRRHIRRLQVNRLAAEAELAKLTK